MRRQLKLTITDVETAARMALTFRSIREGFRCQQLPHLGVLNRSMMHQLSKIDGRQLRQPTKPEQAPNVVRARGTADSMYRVTHKHGEAFTCQSCSRIMEHQLTISGTTRCQYCYSWHRVTITNDSRW